MEQVEDQVEVITGRLQELTREDWLWGGQGVAFMYMKLGRRHADRDDSTINSRQFTQAVRLSCTRSARRIDAQAAGASAAMGPVSTALQALAQLSQAVGSGASAAAPQQHQAPSFLQTAEEPSGQPEEEDLLDVFSGPSAEGQDDAQSQQHDDASVAPALEAQPASLAAATQQDEGSWGKCSGR